MDLACGTGQLLFNLNNNFEYSIGADISENMI